MTLPGVRPPRFSGDDTIDVADFVLRLRRYAIATQIDELQFSGLLALQLQGSAERWLTVQYPNPEQLPPPAQLCQELIIRFTNATMLDRLSAELDALRQTGSIADYANRFQVLVARLHLPDDAELRRKFLRGLKTNGRVQLAMHDPETLMDSIKMATRFELAFAGALQQSTSRSSASNSRSTFRAHRDDTSMDVDAISTDQEDNDEPEVNAIHVKSPRDEERDQCRQRGLCFKCKKHGHRAFECPDRLNASQ
ncbi:hypothetical protein GGI00_004352 [Coemansia sp. RSA 2681]|nr:hypothetical protein GGI00_004352 [Coemansia sp. RSA 2681]